VPASAFGQEGDHNAWGGRAFASFNVGAQTASPNFGYQFTTTLFDQSAVAGLNTPGKAGLSFDIGAGVRLVQNFGVGVTFSRYSNERTGTLTTTIPSPLATLAAYLPPGYISTEASTISKDIPLQREENAIHIQAMYRVPIGNKIQVGMFGGPSYFRCADDHITGFGLQGDIGYNPPFPWTVSFLSVSQAIDRGSSWGYNAGGSFTYLMTRHVGVGTSVRYSEASHATTNHFSDTSYLAPSGAWGGDSGTSTVTMKHGGLQWNGGVSFHF
jgi:hypothetical protein